MSSKSWIVEDSEDEKDITYEELKLESLRTQTTVAATVSRKTSPAAQTPSPQQAITPKHSNPLPSMPVAQTTTIPAKPARPRPIPAYKGAPGWKPSEDSTNTVRTTPQIRKAATPAPPPSPASDPAFSLSVAERAKVRQRSSPGQQRHDEVDRENKKVDNVNLRKPETIIELSVDSSPARAGPSKAAQKTKKKSASSSKPAPPSEFPSRRPVLHSDGPLPPSDPPLPSSRLSGHGVPTSPIFGTETNRHANTPHSSPSGIRKNKRQKTAHDGDDDGEFMDVDVQPTAKAATKGSTASKKEKKRGKTGDKRVPGGASEEKEQKGKISSTSKSSSKEMQQDFKSKEFIDESEDELLMNAGSAKDKSSDPSTACTSVKSSLPTESAENASNRPLSLARVIVDIPTVPRSDISSHAPSAAGSTDSSRSKGRRDTDEVDPSSENRSKKAQKPKKKEVRNDNAKPADPPVPAKQLADVINEQHRSAKDASKAATTTAREQEKLQGNWGNKRKRVIASDDEDEDNDPETHISPDPPPVPVQVTKETVPCTPARPQSTTKLPKGKGEEVVSEKENANISTPAPAPVPKPAHSSQIPPTPTAAPTVSASSRSLFSSNARFSSQSTGNRRSSMSDLIRRVSAKTNSPLASPSPALPSPLAKSSRVALSRIAPLHANRRTPPPPPPRPPAPKKSKKMIELEEKWEMELAETIEGWSVMSQEERALLMRQKKDMELGYDD